MTRRHETLKITKLARRYDKKTKKFTFNITYQTTTEITPRTTTVAQAFGLGIDQTQKFTLYDNTELKIAPKDIVYITGDSGSGKSTLLKAIKKDLKEANEQTTDTAETNINPHKPIIDTLGKTFHEALELLSRVGLNDAFLLLRRYNELSDGQKHRYQLAKLIENGKQWWITDEFCSTLDRDTAKIVAFNIQKTARKMGKTVLAATTHTDLLKDLKPSVHIHKSFGKEIQTTYHPNELNSECSLTQEMQIKEGTFNDYKKLSPFHYRTKRCPPPRKIFTLKRKDELCGVIVYSYPPPITFGRNKAWKGNFQQLQKEVSTISRVIIHPKYRTIGLGKKLVKETLPSAGTPYIETLAVMAKYNPFFEKAGMQKTAESKPNKNVLNTIEKLRNLGFNPTMLESANYDMEKIKETGKEKITTILVELSKKEVAVRKRLSSSSKAYPKHEEFTRKISQFDEERLAKTLKKLNFLAQTKVYLFWKH